MADDTLFNELGMFLLKKGYTVKYLTRGCFDLLARKGEQILLIKVLADANAIMQEHAEEMLKVASFIRASPLVVAGRAGVALEDNVVYTRFGIFTLSLQTLRATIESRHPFIRSTKAGLVADIDGTRLRRLREERGMSLAELSRRVGVSRQMVQRYETEKVELTITKAAKMHDALGDEVFSKVDLFAVTAPVAGGKASPITAKYARLGFQAARMRKVPFDVIAKRDREVILTEVGDKVDPNIAPLSRLLDAERLVIFRKKRPKDLPSVSRQEFMEFEEAEELIRFLKEF